MERGSYPLHPWDGPYLYEVPHMHWVRFAGALCRRKALVQAARGDGSGAARWLRICMGVVRSMGDRAHRVEGLTWAAMDRAVVSDADSLLGLSVVPEQDLVGLRMEFGDEAERLTMRWFYIFQMFEAHYGYANVAAERQEPDALGESARDLPPSYLWAPGWKEKDELFCLGVLEDYVDLADLPVRQRLQEAKRRARQVERQRKGETAGYLVSGILLPGVVEITRSVAEAEARLKVAAALAVEQWRLENGGWPDSLEQLTPDMLPEVPRDPMADRPFSYRGTERGVVVYSLGFDGRDDGGVDLEGGRLWGEEPPSHDMPFRLLHPELRGAEQATFREELLRSDVTATELEEAGFDEEKLKQIGFDEQDVEELWGRPRRHYFGAD